jgi:hypothetical protein
VRYQRTANAHGAGASEDFLSLRHWRHGCGLPCLSTHELFRNRQFIRLRLVFHCRRGQAASAPELLHVQVQGSAGRCQTSSTPSIGPGTGCRPARWWSARHRSNPNVSRWLERGVEPVPHSPGPSSKRNPRTIPPARRAAGVDHMAHLLGAHDERRAFPGSIAGRKGAGPALSALQSISTQPLIPAGYCWRETIG